MCNAKEQKKLCDAHFLSQRSSLKGLFGMSGLCMWVCSAVCYDQVCSAVCYDQVMRCQVAGEKLQFSVRAQPAGTVSTEPQQYTVTISPLQLQVSTSTDGSIHSYIVVLLEVTL